MDSQSMGNAVGAGIIGFMVIAFLCGCVSVGGGLLLFQHLHVHVWWAK